MGHCKNPLCDHWVPVGCSYCCHQCGLAHEGKYEIHEDGPLGHGDWCLAMREKRGACPAGTPHWSDR